MKRPGIAAALALLAVSTWPALAAAPPLPARTGPWLDSSMGMLQGELTARFGPGQKPRVQRGLAQVARFWQPRDGGADVFEAFVRDQFAGEPQALDRLYERLGPVLASLEEPRPEDFRRRDPGAPLPIDRILDGFDPGAHRSEDCFGNKLAFAVLLNFPLTTLDERLREGAGWTARQWAEARLAEPFAVRIPAEVSQTLAQAGAQAQRQLAGHGLPLHQLLDVRNRRPFPEGARLEADGDPKEVFQDEFRDGQEGLLRLRLAQKALERDVTQTLPATVFDNALVSWNPVSNGVQPAGSPTVADDTRYLTLLRTFQAARKLDPYAPATPTWIIRRFTGDRQLPEARVASLLEQVCGSPLAAATARLISSRVGRKLEPFDLWYGGFSRALPDPGHAVQRCCSRGRTERPPLAGLPGPAFAQALAWVQARGRDPGQPAKSLAALDAFWSAWGSAGAALVDLADWHWLYDHPEAGPGELKEAVLANARMVWNRFFAPILGQKDCVLLARSGHLIDGSLDQADAALGSLIALQIQRQLDRTGQRDGAFERMAGLGWLTPDLWLERATGGPLGSEALLEAAAEELKAFRPLSLQARMEPVRWYRMCQPKASSRMCGVCLPGEALSAYR